MKKHRVKDLNQINNQDKSLDQKNIYAIIDK